MEEITRLELHKNRQNIFKQGDIGGRFLARLAQQEYQATTISEIETLNGQRVKEPEEILEAFREYYSLLYTSSLPRLPPGGYDGSFGSYSSQVVVRLGKEGIGWLYHG